MMVDLVQKGLGNTSEHSCDTGHKNNLTVRTKHSHAAGIIGNVEFCATRKIINDIIFSF